MDLDEYPVVDHDAADVDDIDESHQFSFSFKIVRKRFNVALVPQEFYDPQVLRDKLGLLLVLVADVEELVEFEVFRRVHSLQEETANHEDGIVEKLGVVFQRGWEALRGCEYFTFKEGVEIALK